MNTLTVVCTMQHATRKCTEREFIPFQTGCIINKLSTQLLLRVNQFSVYRRVRTIVKETVTFVMSVRPCARPFAWDISAPH